MTFTFDYSTWSAKFDQYTGGPYSATNREFNQLTWELKEACDKAIAEDTQLIETQKERFYERVAQIADERRRDRVMADTLGNMVVRDMQSAKRSFKRTWLFFLPPLIVLLASLVIHGPNLIHLIFGTVLALVAIVVVVLYRHSRSNYLMDLSDLIDSQSDYELVTETEIFEIERQCLEELEAETEGTERIRAYAGLARTILDEMKALGKEHRLTYLTTSEETRQEIARKEMIDRQVENLDPPSMESLPNFPLDVQANPVYYNAFKSFQLACNQIETSLEATDTNETTVKPSGLSDSIDSIVSMLDTVVSTLDSTGAHVTLPVVTPFELPENETSFELEPGDWYLGDPGYVIPNTPWQELVDLSTDDVLSGYVNGHPVVSFHTYYGDGTYESSENESYPIDSGLIGLVPMALIEELDMGKQVSHGTVVTAKEFLTLTYVDGLFKIVVDGATITIQTNI